MDSKVITIILTIILIAAQAYFDKKRKEKRAQSKMSSKSSEDPEDDYRSNYNPKYEDYEDFEEEEIESKIELKLESLLNKESEYVHITDIEKVVEEEKPIVKKGGYQSIDMKQRLLDTEMDAVYNSSEISSFVQSNYEQQDSPISDLESKPETKFFKEGVDPRLMIIYSEIYKPKFLD